MEPNEKLLSVSRFQIGLSKADLQPSAGVCTTQALNKSRWSDFSPAPLLEALSPLGRVVPWKLLHASGS